MINEHPLFTSTKICDDDITNNEEIQNPLPSNKRNIISTDKKQHNKEFINKGEDVEFKDKDNRYVYL
jgi:hypothetical protein